MKKVIRVTDETYRHIKAAAIGTFDAKGVQLPDGDWHIAIEESTYNRLVECQLDGETWSETINRLLAASK